MVLPLLGAVVLLFAFRLQNENAAIATGSSFKLVVDAGHGGTDEGAIGKNNLKEKDITLALSKKIKELSADYGIDVVLVRSDDVYMSPAEKVNFANKQNADAFISVHVNAADAHKKDNSSGIEVMVSKDNKQFEQSKLFGSALLQSLSKDFKINNNLVEPKTSVWVLKANSLPAVLAEFGYIDNDDDVKKSY
ncbi:MAG TPA: N-acetylmuramoyl-L-alanine amidase [Chitinophagaceae bacterium]|nr:N-acetylmuramoyl-L-alanine amidase [Chitinophagaceae bacterium]